MGIMYAILGVTGYWSRGDEIQGMIIFSLGNGTGMRIACALTLVQALSQYMVNLNVWTHNLLTLFGRSGGSSAKPGSSSADTGAGGGHSIHSSSDHSCLSWLATSTFVVIYSYLVSTSVPHFTTLVSLVTSATFLISSYALPAWFTLRLVKDLGWVERVAMWALIPFSLALSAVGLYGSIVSLIQNVEAGEGWSA